MMLAVICVEANGESAKPITFFEDASILAAVSALQQQELSAAQRSDFNIFQKSALSFATISVRVCTLQISSRDARGTIVIPPHYSSSILVGVFLYPEIY
jgi:hypothetical protein